MNFNNSKRRYAFMLDFTYIFIIQILASIFPNLLLYTDNYSYEIGYLNGFLFFNSLFILLILKDILIDGSIGKQEYGLMIVNKNGQKATIFYRILRNLSFLIILIDVIVWKIFGERIGDIVAGTRVVETENIKPVPIWKKILIFIILFLFACFIELAKTDLFTLLINYSPRHKLESRRIESSLNKELSGIISDSSEVWVTDKNMEVHLLTEHIYRIKGEVSSIYQDDKNAVITALSKSVDTTKYPIKIILISDKGSKKSFSTFYINKKH